MLGFRDAEACVERGQVIVDAALVGLHDGLCVGVEPGADALFPLVDIVLGGGVAAIRGA